jgi:hypothetical protein
MTRGVFVMQLRLIAMTTLSMYVDHRATARRWIDAVFN